MRNTGHRTICVESRTTDSVRAHFNRPGDWLPRLIIWPEYSGTVKDELEVVHGWELDDQTDQQWGQIIARTLMAFSKAHDLETFAFERDDPGFWKQFFARQVESVWRRGCGPLVDADYVNYRQHEGHDSPILLLTPAADSGRVPTEIRAPTLDRANLLPFGVAIAELGIEEAVLDISFSSHGDSFLRILSQVSSDFAHDTVQADKHFVSHWIVANKTAYGDDWNSF